MNSNTTTRIRRLTELLVTGKVDLESARRWAQYLSVRRLFDSINEEDVASLRSIDWYRVTGVAFEHFPDGMSVSSILALPNAPQSQQAETIIGSTFRR